MTDEKITSCVKLDLVWVSFVDKGGSKHNRLMFRNPSGRSLLWDVGADRGLTIPVGGQSFEEQENLKMERMDNMSLTRAPDWIEEKITEIVKDTDHYVEEAVPTKAASADTVKSAEKAAGMDNMLKPIGSVSNEP